MSIRDVHCVMPPNEELFNQIVLAKQRLEAGAELSDAVDGTQLDSRALALILSRPVQTRAHTLSSSTPEFAPVVGSRKALVLLVDFSDAAASTGQAHYQDLLFAPTATSMRGYFKEASYNKLDVTGTVSGSGGPTAGWFRAPETKAFYTNGNYGFGTYPRNAQRLVEDAIALADPHVNFANFDNDGDGVVDALVIICAGTGAEATGNVNDIWSHKWGITPQTRDGVSINSYFMAPEDGKVGVMAHELGHLLLGLPDLYDTDYSSAGTGGWDLMAGGSWNGGGNRPAHPTAWCKAKIGWVTPTVIHNASQSITMRSYAQNPDVFKLPIGDANSKEYFLLSNRQKTGYDDNLPGDGLIIEHVDENKTNNTDENHYLVDIEQCDGQRHLNTNANRGDATDPYPCSANSAFNAGTTPNSNSYSGSASQVAVTNVARSGSNITADASVGSGGVAWHFNKTIRATYAFHTSQWAWAFIDGIGWRRIKDGAADGVTNLFAMCCEGVANGQSVHVQIDSQFIYAMYLV